jgi:hypothetical protein
MGNIFADAKGLQHTNTTVTRQVTPRVRQVFGNRDFVGCLRCWSVVY